MLHGHILVRKPSCFIVSQCFLEKCTLLKFKVMADHQIKSHSIAYGVRAQSCMVPKDSESKVELC